jgi:V/A-type H+-transporting ATPase subunit I
MIVPMKKITMLCLDSDQARAVSSLQDLGLIHIEPLQPPENSDVAAIRARRETLGATQAILLAWADPQVKPSPPLPPHRLDETINRVRALDGERRELKLQIEAVRTEIARWEPFGHFDLRQIQALADTGIRVKLLFIPGPKSPVFPASVQATLLKKTADGFFAAVAALDDQPLPGVEYPLPTQSLRALETQDAQLQQRLTEIETELRALSLFLPQLDRLHTEIEDQVLFEDARAGMKTSGRIACLKGYCPEDALPLLNQTAATNGWAIRVEDPKENDPVPTLVRNPAWIRPIRFLFELIGVVPGYAEVDISAAFLGFYSLFFAMLVGDAGYGVLFLIITLIVKVKIKAAPKDLIRLLLVLSGGTIVWGVLTGSYFGIAHLPGPLADLRIKWLADERNLMQLCFLIGSIHLTLAHVWNLFRAWRQPALLAQLGWIGLIWTMYFMAGNMILDKALPGFLLPLFISSLVLVILFMTPLKAMKTEWYNHIMLPLSVINAFGDVVSYVRLFAVGSAGTAISIAFNQMAVGDGIHSFTSGLSAAIILFLAHSLNILLCALAVIVHGVRLNTLEFSGHLGMQWTGMPYTPLARRSATPSALKSVPS